MINLKKKEVKTLESLFTLSEKVAIYVPSTYAVNIKIVNDKYLQYIEKQLASIFGGSTTTETSGNYVSNNGQLVREKINIVYSYAEKIGNREIDKIIALCEWIKEEMKQESVAMELNGKMYFV